MGIDRFLVIAGPLHGSKHAFEIAAHPPPVRARIRGEAHAFEDGEAARELRFMRPLVIA